jgi:hypothetical protein
MFTNCFDQGSRRGDRVQVCWQLESRVQGFVEIRDLETLHWKI